MLQMLCHPQPKARFLIASQQKPPKEGFSAEELRRTGEKRGALLELLGSLSVLVERTAALPVSRTVREGVE